MSAVRLQPGDLDVLRRMLVRLRRKQFRAAQKSRMCPVDKYEVLLSEERANAIRASALERAIALLQPVSHAP